MLRAFGAIVLILIIAGAVFLTNMRSEDRQVQAYNRGVSKGSAEVASQKQITDSLTAVFGEERDALRDSLVSLQTQTDSLIDTLTSALAAKDAQIARYAAELKKRSTTKATAVAKPATGAALKHQEILAYYKKRYEALPKDLSEYELKVALSEVRTETAAKYSITLTELESIRKKNGLTY